MINFSELTFSNIFKLVFGVELALSGIYIVYKTWMFAYRYKSITDDQTKKELWNRLARMDQDIASLRIEKDQVIARHEADIVRLTYEKNKLVVMNLEAIFELRGYQVQIAALEANLAIQIGSKKE